MRESSLSLSQLSTWQVGRGVLVGDADEREPPADRDHLLALRPRVLQAKDRSSLCILFVSLLTASASLSRAATTESIGNIFSELNFERVVSRRVSRNVRPIDRTQKRIFTVALSRRLSISLPNRRGWKLSRDRDTFFSDEKREILSTLPFDGVALGHAAGKT